MAKTVATAWCPHAREQICSEITSDEIFNRRTGDRFWSKVDQCLYGCWPWRGALTHTGKTPRVS